MDFPCARRLSSANFRDPSMSRISTLQPTARGLVLVVLVSLVVSFGCKVQREDVEWWKTTVKGPGKIVAVVLANKYPVELRVQAAQALVEMERPDADGLRLLNTAIQRLDPAERSQIVDQLVPGLIEVMFRSTGTAGNGDGALQTTDLNKRAKDAAFVVAPHASPDAREKLTEAVMRWYAQDFPGRSLAGNYSLEQVTEAFGTSAARQLVPTLGPALANEGITKVAELIARFGDPTIKEAAARKLVEMSQSIDTAAYTERFNAEVKARFPNATPEQLGRGTAQLRERRFNDAVVVAMRSLAAQPVVATRLAEIAVGQTNPPNVDPEAILTRRSGALVALRGKARRDQLPAILQLALAKQVPPAVRDNAFDVIQEIGGTGALPELWRSLADPTTDQRMRWRVADLILALGGNAVVNEFFAKLPAAREEGYAPEELASYAQRMSAMVPEPSEIIRQKLISDRWWDRVIALRYLEKRGTQNDLARVRELKTDTTAVKGPGWPAELPNVGKVAESVETAMRERLTAPAAQPARP